MNDSKCDCVAHAGSDSTKTITIANGPLEPLGVVGGKKYSRVPLARAVRRA